MRLTFLLTTLLLPLLTIVAASTGCSDSQEEAILIEDPEAVALQIGDVAMDFAEVEGSAKHITNSESCASTQEDERDECLSQLEEWGRLDGYEVEYAANDPEAFLSGTYRVFGAVSIYRDQEGAAEAFRVGEERLQEELRQLEDAAAVEIPTVGDESVAFVTIASQRIGKRDVSVSLHVIDFRQENVLARIGATAPTALATVDDALEWAQKLDQRILQATGRISPTASPSATP
ncbi:MAG: hypothetical protein AMJ77_03505 [Dehalococcoidia bacterium SM23_28_2]|nr:MAG: hypothetical protein AMJ77_03505 [Dehalococcoidia bacterium SM23_28_2]